MLSVVARIADFNNKTSCYWTIYSIICRHMGLFTCSLCTASQYKKRFLDKSDLNRIHRKVIDLLIHVYEFNIGTHFKRFCFDFLNDLQIWNKRILSFISLAVNFMHFSQKNIGKFS